MNKKLSWLLILLICTACAPAMTEPPAGLVGMQVQSAADFARAYPGRTFNFPADHGAHLEYQTEWWYYTGNLSAPDGSRFGYQLTFFRRGLQTPQNTMPRRSDWATNQVYMAHFAITDLQKNKFRFFEHLERGAAGLAGAQSEPAFRVWMLDWSAEQTGPNSYRVQAQEGNAALQLELQELLTAPILQGAEGYSQKGAEVGNASFYYSQPRLLTSGTLSLGEQVYQVEGESWMDHEFSTSALEENQVGWDWFALQLDDGSELMVFTLRNTDGSLSDFSQGTLILPDGAVRRLARADFRISVTGKWLSPISGAEYPAGWLVEVPEEDLRLEISPLIADQELRVSFTYWEGAVEVRGAHKGNPVAGRGYVELTGYAHSMQGRL